MSQYGRGLRTSIPTPGMLNHKQAVEASEKLCASYRQGKLVREGKSDPEWSEDEPDNNRGHRRSGSNDHIDNVAVELMADERKCQDLIKKIQRHDMRNDHLHMDEDELQEIWDAGKGKGKKKAERLFSNGSKVVDHGPARPAISPVAGNKANNRPDNPRKCRRLIVDEGHAKHARAHDAAGRRAAQANPRGSKPSSHSTTSSRLSTVPGSRKVWITSSGHPRSVCADSQPRPRPSHHRGSRPSSATPPPSPKRRPGIDCTYTGHTTEDASGVDTGFDEEYLSEGLDTQSRTEKDSSKKQKSDRGRSGEFQGVERELVDATVELMYATMLRRGMFPDPQQYTHWIVRSWSSSIKKLKLSPQKYLLTKRHTQAIRDRINSFCGRLRDHVKSIFSQRFEFRGGKTSSKGIEREVKAMLPYEFHRKEGAEPGKGWFQHPFVQRIVCEAFFTGWSPIGIQFPEIFNPFPAKAVSLLCAMTMFLLGQWSTGKYVKQRMTIDSLKPLYEKQQRMMAKFCEKQGKRADEVFVFLYEQSMSDMSARVPTLDIDSTVDDDDLNDDMFAEDIPSGAEDYGYPVRSRQRRCDGSADETGPAPPSGVPKNEDSVEACGLDFGNHAAGLDDRFDRPHSPIGERRAASRTPPPVAGPSGSALGRRSQPHTFATLLGSPVRSPRRRLVEIVIPSVSKKKGPSAAKSAGKLRIIGSQSTS